jgi:hypothetical protein
VMVLKEIEKQMTEAFLWLYLKSIIVCLIIVCWFQLLQS